MGGTHGMIAAIVALVMGLLILVAPRLLNYAVAIYLIVIGILGLLPYFAAGPG